MPFTQYSGIEEAIATDRAALEAVTEKFYNEIRNHTAPHTLVYATR